MTLGVKKGVVSYDAFMCQLETIGSRPTTMNWEYT